MASPSERSSSSRSTANLMPGRIVIVCDATKNLCAKEFNHIIDNILMKDFMIQEVDAITVLAVLHKVLHPMGFEMQIGPDSFIGTRVRAIEDKVSRMLDEYVRILQRSAEECADNGVDIEVKVVVGAPLKKVVIQEVIASNATWVVLNRHLKKELRYYLKHIPCKVAMTLDNFSLEVLRSYYSDKETAPIEHEVFYSLSKIVPLLPIEYSMNDEQSTVSPSYREPLSSHGSSDSERSSSVSSRSSKPRGQSLFSPDEFRSNPRLEKSDSYVKVKDHFDNSHDMMKKQSLRSESNLHFVSTSEEMTPEQDSRAWKESEIQIVTDDFSSDFSAKVDAKSDDSYPTIERESNRQLDSDAFRPSDEMKMRQDLKECNYSDIQIATNDFSSENLLGEDGYGVVYKGRLKEGQLIAVKLQKEANTQGFSEFYSQVCVQSLVCHRNIVILLGYCRRENLNILVYEYICNRSLKWHLFENKQQVLDWHQRHAIAIGIAKGLRFLHEECRGSPIIHKDIRPSNIFLTHELVPLLGNCGLAKGTQISLTERQTFLALLSEYQCTSYPENDLRMTLQMIRTSRFLTLRRYLAPEYAENGICSVKTDIYSFGIVLIQLISGRKQGDLMKDNHHHSLRQWALPLIETLTIDELADPRLEDSYSTYELYQMAKAAYLCSQPKSSMRPTIGEVLHILEGKNEHLNQLVEQYIPHPSNNLQ